MLEISRLTKILSIKVVVVLVILVGHSIVGYMFASRFVSMKF